MPSPLSTKSSARPHSCTFCSRAFRKLEHLRRHTRIHTKEKPYTCHCGCAFSRRDLLQRHTRLVHATTLDSGDKPTSSNPPSQDLGSTIKSSIPARSSETDLVNESDRVLPEQFLPYPPEYHGLDLPRSNEHDEDNPLFEFHAFVNNSGLGQLTHTPQQMRIPRSDPHHDPPQHDGEGPFTFSPHYSSLGLGSSRDINSSDSILQDYLKEVPGFLLPSPPKRQRYLKSYMQNSRMQLVHSAALIDETCIPLQLAVLALGAYYLFEFRDSKSLFHATKTITFRLLASSQMYSPEDETTRQPNLASTFVVLLEYTKLAQPLHLHHDIALLHGGLVSSLALPQYCSIAAPDNESSLSIKSEMDRRAQVYGFCAAATNSFWLKTLPMLQFPSAGIHFPRPRSIQVSPLVNSHNTSSGDSFPPAQEILTSYRSLLTPRSNGHDSQPLNLSYDETFVLAMTHMSQVSILEGLADTSIEADGHNRHLHAIAMLTRELDMREANTSQAKIKVPKTLSRDIRALLQLMAIRNHFHGGLYDSHALFRNDASLLASDISTHIGPFAPSLDSTLCLLEDCVRNLEQPATTGVAFFLRTHMSSWGLEIALSTFESALFLAKWINQLQSVAMPSQFDTRIIGNIMDLLPVAWSSVDMVDRTPLCRSFLEISISLLKFWSYVFMSMENKEYVKFLGETLLNYADILASPAEI